MFRPEIVVALAGLSCALQAGAQVGGSTIQVPRGGPITMDGRLEDAEWGSAMRVEHPAGTVVRLMRDADHLYVGIASERQGFGSLCLGVPGAVHVLHASAALGAVTYRQRGEAWQSADTAFTYGMRNTALDDAARAQRAAYLATHGWVASTVRMGNNQQSQEFAIALGTFPLPMSMALGRWLFTNSVESWPASLADHEGCISQRLVQGYVPQGLTFSPARWLRIETRQPD